MRVLVTGAKGQLGQDLIVHIEKYPWAIYGLGKAELDITNVEQVSKVITGFNPDVIIHTAAYTKVDQAEKDRDDAFRVNGEGTKNIAKAAASIGAKFCYISTDYVFDGENKIPYSTEDKPNPQTVYGESKLAGEKYTKQYCEKYFIVRTSWVFGLYGNNFVKTMLRLAKEKDEIGVVHDQTGSPTYTADLAKFLIELVQSEKYGTYHASNSGQCTWYEFAKEIFKQAGLDTKVIALTTDQFPRPANRPKYSVMANSTIENNGFQILPHWKESTQLFIEVLKEKEKVFYKG
ncbi:dTDP-4-dehydrorhamnose reductase [Bacillus sp. RG28]|uniref:dTDP-4-dehydrorhamnose reductase n=1 Tax=Gottfriedia endophytica TaxID=2820819 RepID=A0A940SGJ3_9BACI|nr:dTDP-4-dehydrorhamnose reductase [Gottfriedia endophytica]MBP0725132.1 dTDP-4-dehydrorhamnose reductase [Gottfriedia endophytica]